ncbi:MAG: insulinase family protein, partial [Flavobacteriales bacterium]|nr:insulinase family protein [Flavobacteriales bacterium]
MTAQLDRSTPPPPGPAPIVDLGAHSKFTLPNGLQVIVVENHKLPMVSVQVRFDIPPIAQDEKAGYIDMVSELLTAGAGGRTKAELDDEVDRLGASLHASSTGLYASGLKRNLGPLLDVVRDVIQEPVFPEAEFEKSRTRFRAAVQQRQDDPDSIAEAVGKAAIFGIGHPYGEITTEETLNAITLDAIKAFHRRFFRPGSGY